jgi:hypothetical protein
MYNLSKKGHKLPSELIQEQAVHKARMQDRNKALQEDAKRFAIKMYQRGVDDPEDILSEFSGVQYWEYVRRYDPQYLRDVERTAKHLNMDVRRNPERYIPSQPPQPKRGPQGGGGMPPPMAFNLRSVKKVAGAKGEWEAVILPDGTVEVRGLGKGNEA